MHSSFATRPNLDLLEQNYERWQKDRAALDSGWSAFFEGFELGSLDGKNGATAEAAPEARRDVRESPLQTRIDALVYAYRILGHTIARVNPLAEKRPENPRIPGRARRKHRAARPRSNPIARPGRAPRFWDGSP